MGIAGGSLGEMFSLQTLLSPGRGRCGGEPGCLPARWDGELPARALPGLPARAVGGLPAHTVCRLPARGEVQGGGAAGRALKHLKVLQKLRITGTFQRFLMRVPGNLLELNQNPLLPSCPETQGVHCVFCVF